MTTASIQKKIARAIELKHNMATLKNEFDALSAELIAEAESRPEEHKPTEGGGWSWEQLDAVGNLARVTQPAAALKETISPLVQIFPKVVELSGEVFPKLFAAVTAYRPVEDFRSLAVAHLGREGKKLIKLCSKNSKTAVSFEVAERVS